MPGTRSTNTQPPWSWSAALSIEHLLHHCGKSQCGKWKLPDGRQTGAGNRHLCARKSHSQSHADSQTSASILVCQRTAAVWWEGCDVRRAMGLQAGKRQPDRPLLREGGDNRPTHTDDPDHRSLPRPTASATAHYPRGRRSQVPRRHWHVRVLLARAPPPGAAAGAGTSV